MDQDERAAPDGPHGPEGFAYLLVQLGTRAARRFADGWPRWSSSPGTPACCCDWPAARAAPSRRSGS